MPKLLLFAACQKAIVEQQTNVLSLLSLIQHINVQVPVGATVPENAAIPMDWVAVSIWEQEHQDRGKTFEQRCLLVTGDNRVRLETLPAVFEFKDQQHRVLNQIAGLPIGTAGRHSLKCQIREQGQADWIDSGTYPITIHWQTQNTSLVH